MILPPRKYGRPKPGVCNTFATANETRCESLDLAHKNLRRFFMKFKIPNMAGFGGHGGDEPPPVPSSGGNLNLPRRSGWAGRLISLFVAGVAIYVIYFWEFRRV